MVGIASECSDPDIYVNRLPGVGAARNRLDNLDEIDMMVNRGRADSRAFAALLRYRPA